MNRQSSPKKSHRSVVQPSVVALIAALAVIAGLGTYIATQNVPDSFHRYYYDKQVWENTKWLGVRIQKLPMDLVVYQEILYELKPDVIVEAGTNYGGSAYFFASMMDLIGNGRVITIDIKEQPNRPQHPRITYLLGSSTAPDTIAKVRSLIPAQAKVMVVLDSDHSRDHVLNELRLYQAFVSPRQYLVVEDTNVNGHPVFRGHGPGPMEALDAFLEENRDFEIDQSREKFLLTFNPRGYLKKKR